MNFFEDIQKKAKAEFEKQMTNVGPYLQSQILGAVPLVKLGINPGGNLSAKEIAQGKKPVQETLKPNNNKESQGPSYMVPIAIGAGVLVVLYLVMRK